MLSTEAVVTGLGEALDVEIAFVELLSELCEFGFVAGHLEKCLRGSDLRRECPSEALARLGCRRRK